MAGEIATAFVRIRPNLAGFQSETESGMTRVFRGITEAIGLAFGAKEVFDFGKGAVEGAANLQHQIEGIRTEFGAASASVVKFGANAGHAFGIAAETADTTANQFGILLRNLGIGPGLASEMTINLEKLAGSLATIRGIDPSQVLATLPSALLGNVRALKSLGLPIDSTQIKLAAFKLGLISTINQGLTPAQKALAVYSLATAHLGELQAQAAKHSGDLTSVQARLTAEWKNAKDALGAALLPEFTKLASAVEKWLTSMQKSGKLQHDFNEIAKTTVDVVKLVASTLGTAWKVWTTVTGWIGGTKNALITLFAILSIEKIRSIAGAIVTQLVNNGFVRLRIATEAEKAAYLDAFGTMEVATIGLGATIKSALISTGIGALVVAVGIAVGFIITHWDTVKRYTVALANGLVAIWGGLKTTLLGIAEEIGGGLATALTAPLRAFLELADQVTGALAKVGAFGFHPFAGPHKVVDAALKGLKDATTGLVGSGAGNVEKGLSEIGNAFGAAFSKSLADSASNDKSKAQVKDAGKKIGQAINDGITSTVATVPAKIATTVSDAMKLALQAAQQRIQNAITSAKDNLDKIGAKLATSVNNLLDKLGPSGPAGAAQKAAIARLQKLIESGAPGFAITRASEELSSNLQEAGKQNTESKTARHNAIKEQIANLTDAFNSGKINLATFNKRLTDALKKDKVNYKIAGKELGSAFADGFQAEIKGLRDQAAAIAAVPARLRNLGGGGGGADIRIIRPLEVIRRENQIIADKAAKQRQQQIKAAERAAKAAEKTATTLTQLKAVQVAPLPGHQSKKARGNAKAGVRP